MTRLYRLIDFVFEETVLRTIDIFFNRGNDHVRAMMVRPVIVPQHPPTRTVQAQPQVIPPEVPVPVIETGPPIELPGADEAPTFRTLSTLLETREEGPKHVVAYTMSTGLPLFRNPTKEFDGILTRLPYGAMVLVLKEEGRFCKVAYGEREGWVLRDELAYRPAHVFPDFMRGQAHMHDDPNTLRVRAYIEDAFGGGEAEMPLQAGEYVLFRLMRQGKSVLWDSALPRIPGRWHTLLKGKPGVHVGIQPKEGSIMECTLLHDVGHLAYVESVLPDERIAISEVNYPDSGTYNERTLTKEEWKELRPVFIAFG